VKRGLGTSVGGKRLVGRGGDKASKERWGWGFIRGSEQGLCK
jgi:hypothetical protein